MVADGRMPQITTVSVWPVSGLEYIGSQESRQKSLHLAEAIAKELVAKAFQLASF